MPSALVRVLSSPALMLHGVRRGGALLVDLAPGDLFVLLIAVVGGHVALVLSVFISYGTWT